MAILELTIPGDPVVKGRPRADQRGHMYTPKRTQNAEKYVAGLAMAAMAGKQPADVPVGLAVEFYCQTRRRCDGDNLLKLVTDAMNRIAYTDDSLIEEWFCRVHRGAGKDAARTEVLVWLLG